MTIFFDCVPGLMVAFEIWKLWMVLEVLKGGEKEGYVASLWAEARMALDLVARQRAGEVFMRNV